MSADTGRPVVAQLITTLARGGAQATVLASADRSAMAGLGVEVVVLSGKDDTGGGSFWDDPALDAVDVVAVPGLVRRIAPFRDLRCLLWLIRWLRANRPAVVHTHSSKAGVLGRLAAFATRTPCVHTVHGWGPLYASNRFAASAAALVERMLAAITEALVVVGESDLRHGLAAGIGRPGRYRVIRSGVDIERSADAALDRASIREELGLDRRFVVGMVARMAEPKDHATLVRAFGLAELPEDSILVLVGDGPQRQAIDQLVAACDLTDRVRSVGARADGQRMVAAFDVAVLSSQWEGMPRAVVEAAAASVPIVASDVGAVHELIDDGISGRLLPVGDVAAMADALADAYDRPEAYRNMAEVAQRRAEAFSADRMRRELVELWCTLAGHHGARRSEPPVPDAGVPVASPTQAAPAARSAIHADGPVGGGSRADRSGKTGSVLEGLTEHGAPVRPVAEAATGAAVIRRPILAD